VISRIRIQNVPIVGVLVRRAARGSALLAAILIGAHPAASQSSAGSDNQQLGRSILKELIETNTTHGSGNTTEAAQKMAARFLGAGFPEGDVQVVGPREKNRNLVVRYRSRSGSSETPILFIAHLDVVEARREDWSVDPFVLLEKDGYFYGRGTLDVKGGGATLVAAFLRLRQEGWVPDRDLILALTAGEEAGADYNGVQWLIQNRKDVMEAAYCLNVDAGGPEMRGGKVVSLDVQASEKVFQSFSWTVRNPGGHSSLPTKNNAIYHLAGALSRWSQYDFPPRMTDVTRAYFERSAPLVGGKLGDDMRAVTRARLDTAAARRLSGISPFYNALLRTTCVATLLEGGHAENALPQMARAVVNCRMLPGEDPKAIQREMVRVVADTQVVIDTLAGSTPSPPSPLSPDVERILAGTARSMWGPIPIVPYMETGATDGAWLRTAGMPVYGVTGVAYDPDDVRAHGRDERITVQGFNYGLEFAYRLMKAVSGGSAAP